VRVRGSSVIDYVIVNEAVGDKISRFKVGERVDSDHLPLEVELSTEEERKQEEELKRTSREEEREVIVWNKEAIRKYREKTEELNRREIQEEGKELSIEEKWERIKEVVIGAMVRSKKKWRIKEIGHKDWWDRSCTKKKRELKRIYRRWRKGKIVREKYMEERRRFKLWLEKKQREKREEEEEALKSLRNEKEIWEYINRKRGKRKWVENKIGKEEWRNYFMRLLDGVEVEAATEGTVAEENEKVEEGIEEEEIKKALKKMKMKKAAGIDGIPMEAWRYAGKELWMELVELIKDIWKEGTLPKDWRKSVVVPLYKRGEKEKAGNYRGISLLCTAYKIYAEVLRCRLEKEVEERKVVPDSQAGFRNGRSTIDNVWVLNHLLQRGKRKRDKKEEIYILFADMRAAFDNMDREILWEDMKKKGMNRQLIGRIEKIYEETEVVIRTRKGYTEEFKTRKGVRQGCVMSPILFNVYMADLDNRLRERDIGGVGISGHRVWSLAYADDIALVANNREAMVDMMQTFKRFLREKKLELCVEKTKVLKNNKKKKEIWKWGTERIEEVRKFKYLGFVLNRYGNYKDHIKELGGKERRAARMIWGLGERLCKNDLRRRWILFKYLVRSTMAYGVEIWGWEEKENLEKVMLDYTRWLFRLDFCTPRYLITRELYMDKLKIGWGIRARRYELKVKGGKAGKIAKWCWREKEEEGWWGIYGKERERYYNRNGWGIEAREIKKGHENMETDLMNRDRDSQRQWKDRVG